MIFICSKDDINLAFAITLSAPGDYSKKASNKLEIVNLTSDCGN